MSPEPDPAPPPPPFGESYAKARKAYGLSSALLLAWELVGIEIDANPIETLKISLKSPQAAPYALIAVVVYFAFHFTVEWYQTAAPRRQLRVSRVDFIVAHSIGAAALMLFGVQTLFRIQIANVIPSGALSLFGLGVVIGICTLFGWYPVRFLLEGGWDRIMTPLAVGSVLLGLLAAIAVTLIPSPLSATIRLLIAGGGVIAALLLMVVAQRQMTRILSRAIRRSK